MKIYIAGKITGDPKYRDRFRDAHCLARLKAGAMWRVYESS